MTTEEIGQIVERVARRYARQCPWIERAELVQIGWLAALRALRTFDHERGTALGGYLHRACVLAMYEETHRQTAPVKARAEHFALLREVRRVPVDEAHDLPSVLPNAEEMLDDARRAASVRGHLARLVDEDPEAELAIAVLFGTPSREVAKARDVNVKTVYRATARAKRRLSALAELTALMEE